ncbi:universal stress protein [Marivita sp. GX14005]|uniref:universal stress protein n=1 Tax=Marivita sp. GX14005 TaxID=2942276 RepID=UPI002019DF2D|nr:universal stress protein [Marivita sp. GX14005]MCL3881523.1 universal stress protein [Marivita sp. GX14005]
MTEVIVVGYDGSDVAKRAIDFAVRQATAQSGAVLVVHVLEWSAYSFLTPQELEERHGRRKEEIERAETALMAPLKQTIAAAGVPVETMIRYGHVAKTLCDIAKKQGATQMVVGRDGSGGLSSRVFGSVAGSLVQMAPVPCTIVP